MVETIQQFFLACAYTLSATDWTAPAGGGSVSVNVATTDSTCSWTTSSPCPDWLRVSAASGNGNTPLTVTATANVTGSPRGCVLTIAGQSFTVTQPALAYQWQPSRLSVGVDNKPHLLWERLSDQAVQVWTLSSDFVPESAPSYGPYPGWSPDADGFYAGPDGIVHLDWKTAAGGVSHWLFNAAGGFQAAIPYGPYSGWWPQGSAVGADGMVRLYWTSNTGGVSMWTINSAGGVQAVGGFGPFAGWAPGEAIWVGTDNQVRCLWVGSGGNLGAAAVWTLNTANQLGAVASYGPFAGWTVEQAELGRDNKVRLYWKHSGGAVAVWALNTAQQIEAAGQWGPFAGWVAKGMRVRPDGKTVLIWEHTSGQVVAWVLGSSLGYETGVALGPFAGWEVENLASDGAGRMYLLWKHTSGQIALWRLSPTGALEKYAYFGPY